MTFQFVLSLVNELVQLILSKLIFDSQLSPKVMEILLIFIKQKIIYSFPDSLLVGMDLFHLMAVVVVEVLKVEVTPLKFPILEVCTALLASQVHHLHPIAIRHKCCLVVYVLALGVVLPYN